MRATYYYGKKRRESRDAPSIHGAKQYATIHSCDAIKLDDGFRTYYFVRMYTAGGRGYWHQLTTEHEFDAVYLRAV